MCNVTWIRVVLSARKWGGLGPLASFPGPSPPEERPATHCLRMREIFRYIFRIKLRALPCPYAEDCTHQEYRAFFELDSSDDLS